MKSIIRLLTVFLCLLVSVTQAAGEADPDQKLAPSIDVRVLIDVSGSMKQNDPDNLRVPALKLLVGLLPDDVQAGVWTFGTSVKPIVKHNKVDQNWRLNASQSSGKVTSNDLYTNIELALAEVTSDWKEAKHDTKRNIILLTDGMIDISKSPEESATSRQRVLDEILPELKKSEVTIHTIALSENADLELLDALALSTDGWSEQVQSAEQLQRVFLHMFEKSAPRDTVPLDDNQFTIDKTIDEFTLLVFRDKDNKRTTVTDPEGHQFNRETAPAGIAWYEETGYDMITVSDPIAGDWLIDAEIDPDNRVMIVTKLKLHTSELPNSLFLNETHDFKLWLTAADKIIDRTAFYDLISIEMIQEADGQIQEIWHLTNRSPDNEYTKTVGETFRAGKIDLRVTVDGKTFKREHKQSLHVYDQPVEVEISELAQTKGNKAHLLKITPISDLIDPGKLNIVATIQQPDGTEVKKVAQRTLRGDQLIVRLTDPQPGEYKAVLTIKAESRSGRQLSLVTQPYKLGQKIASEHVTDSEQQDNEPPVEEPEEVNWIILGLSLFGINLLLVLIIGAGWIVYKKRKNKTSQPGDKL